MIHSISNALFAAVLIMLGGYYLAEPNWYRVITPQLFNLSKVSDTLYTDAPERGTEFNEMIVTAQKNAAQFFGDDVSSPVYIVCTTARCHDDFGNPPPGFAMMRYRIFVSPNGVAQTVFNHEQVHTDLYAQNNLLNFLIPRFPIWFNEGLAEFLAGPASYRRNITKEQKLAVMNVNTSIGWNKLIAQNGANVTYGTARAIVSDMSRAIGREKLVALARDVTSLEDFNARMPIFVLPK